MGSKQSLTHIYRTLPLLRDTHLCVLDRSHHLVPTAYNRGQQQLNYIYTHTLQVSECVSTVTYVLILYICTCVYLPYTCTYVLASGMTTYKVSDTSAFMYSVHLYRGKPAHMHVHNTCSVPRCPRGAIIYFLRPGMNAIMEFKRCPQKNVSLDGQG
jgi:hypothetical protein